MPIVSSQVVSVGVQRDGRSYVHERHVDHLGVEHIRHWLANADSDLAAALAAYAVVLVEMLKSAEISANIISVTSNGSLAVLTFNHSTVAENRAALREAYRAATRVEAVMIGDFLNTLTNNQLSSIFNITTQQASTLRTNKLQPAADLATGIRAAAGE